MGFQQYVRPLSFLAHPLTQCIGVREVPTEGTWFQLIQNGNITVNEGPDGLQKLDKVVELAEKHGIYLILSLTNNWNPDGVTTGADNQTLPRNSLSNDYGVSGFSFVLRCRSELLI